MEHPPTNKVKIETRPIISHEVSDIFVKSKKLFRDFEKDVPTVEYIETVIKAEEENALKKSGRKSISSKEAFEEKGQDEISEGKKSSKQSIEVEPSSEDIAEHTEEEFLNEEEMEMEEIEEDEFDKIDSKVIDEAKPISQEELILDFGKDHIILDHSKIELELEVQEEDIVMDTGPIVDNIIKYAVDKSEKADKKKIKREKLDLKKLVKYFMEVRRQLAQEQKRNFLLNKVVVEHFVRKKNSRALQPDNENNIIEIMIRYRDNLIRLDDIKNKKLKISIEIEEILNDLKIKEESLIEKSKIDVEELDSKLKSAGAICYSKKTGRFLPPTFIEGFTNKISYLRREITNIRLESIFFQHRIADLTEKAAKLEDIGNGLKMSDFEQLRAETQAIGEKLEERHNELNKHQIRCNSCNHLLANIREKQDILNRLLISREQVLEEHNEELKSSRNELNRIKMERDKCRSKFNNLGSICGILDKPVLLEDYDNTVEQVKITEERVNRLRMQKELLSKELEKLDKKL